MIKTAPIPKILLNAAVDSLADVLADLGSTAFGADLVWAYFDARVSPGRQLAIEQLLARGSITVAQATTQVDTASKVARSTGQVFAVGALVTGDDFVSLLRRLAADNAGLAKVLEWVRKPVPSECFRLAIIAGTTMQLQLASIDAAIAHRRQRP